MSINKNNASKKQEAALSLPEGLLLASPLAPVTRDVGPLAPIDAASVNTGSGDIQDLINTLTNAYRPGGRLRDLAQPGAPTNDSPKAKTTEKLARLLRRLEETLHHLDIGIMMIDQKERVQLCNRSAIAMLDLPEALIQQRPQNRDVLQYMMDAGEFANVPAEMLAWIFGDAIRNAPALYRRQRPGGTILDVRTIPLTLGGFIRTYTDVTSAVADENAVIAAQAEYRSLFENAVVGVYRSSPDGRQIRANPALVRINGYDSEAEMLAGVKDIAKDWYVDAGRRDEFKRLMARDGRVTDFVSQIYRHATREPIWISETAWQVTAADGQIFYEGTITEVTERKIAQDRINYLALHDQLTGLSNRAAFLEALSQSASMEAGQQTAVFAIDLDGFKNVNDAYGHAVGDKLLVKAALAIRQCAQKGDIVARLGGDEFAIMRVGNLEKTAELGVTAAELIQQLSQAFFIDDKRIRIGASVGFATTENNDACIAGLLQNADTALYHAKRAGRRCFRYFDASMRQEQLKTRDLETDLRLAIEEGSFQLYYQPICNLATGKVASYEALIRWPHPFLGMIPPMEFIPLAEKAGLMVPLGEWIIQQACREAKRLPDQQPVAINISYTQMCDHRFVSIIKSAMKHHGVRRGQLQIEITESVLMSDNEKTVAMLNELRDLGISIALDDFGTGYSSLSYLQKFKFDKIKIDRSFINDAGRKSTNGAITRAIIQLGKDLDIPIVAEGIESQLQLMVLRNEQCTFGQGYLFGKPAPLEALIKA